MGGNCSKSIATMMRARPKNSWSGCFPIVLSEAAVCTQAGQLVSHLMPSAVIDHGCFVNDEESHFRYALEAFVCRVFPDRSCSRHQWTSQTNSARWRRAAVSEAFSSAQLLCHSARPPSYCGRTVLPTRTMRQGESSVPCPQKPGDTSVKACDLLVGIRWLLCKLAIDPS